MTGEKFIGGGNIHKRKEGIMVVQVAKRKESSLARSVESIVPISTVFREPAKRDFSNDEAQQDGDKEPRVVRHDGEHEKVAYESVKTGFCRRNFMSSAIRADLERRQQ